MAQYEAAFERFAATFPTRFTFRNADAVFLDQPKARQEKGRLLNAGFHSMMGYFRDDMPLYEMMLDEEGKHELDRLWQESGFHHLAPLRQHTGYIWYERAESATLQRRAASSIQFRSEDKDITSEAKMQKFAEMYVAKARESTARTAATKLRSKAAKISSRR